jgi:hypothetical protein
MIDLLTFFVIIFITVPLAVVLLGYRDSLKRSKQENAHSIEERIEEIRQNAASSIIDLPELRDEIVKKYPEKQDAWDWIDPIVEYYRRLESLAASTEKSVKDALDLSEEAGQFISNKKLKGILVADSANRLAKLLEQRESEHGDPKNQKNEH